ncbi:MAG: sulfotransferase [Paracoccaceae bacterium]
MAAETAARASEPTVLFCVGATKAGTSWLYQFLQDHPGCHVRTIKELHYFDALEKTSKAWQIKVFQTQKDVVMARIGDGRFADTSRLARRAADFDDLLSLHRCGVEDITGYLAYLNKGRRDETVVADVTPAYSLLPVARLRQMGRVARRVRFIYILRDPVARLWSHIRMNAGRRSGDPDELQARARRMFWSYGRGQQAGIQARGDYRGALERLGAALRPSQLLVLFYEELFSNEAVNRICEFLGLPRQQAALQVPVNVGPSAPMSKTQRQHARGWLADQYVYVQGALDRVPDAWRANMTEGRR